MKDKPPHERRYILIYKCIIHRSGLHVTVGVQQSRDRYAKEFICIVDHLLILQAALQTNITDVSQISRGWASNLDEARKHRESRCIEACGQFEGCNNGLSLPWQKSERVGKYGYRSCCRREGNGTIGREDCTLILHLK